MIFLGFLIINNFEKIVILYLIFSVWKINKKINKEFDTIERYQYTLRDMIIDDRLFMKQLFLKIARLENTFNLI